MVPIKPNDRFTANSSLFDKKTNPTNADYT